MAICTGTGAATDLFGALGGTPDNGGTWNDDDSSGADLTDPTDVDLSALSAGTYNFTYAFAASGGCPADSATVTVAITAPEDTLFDALSDGNVCVAADLPTIASLPT
ncbi:hypothetical protein, partial [Muricauda brasiliensis]|uniref:hypothetical protein n=1 Tax=Muricauda brasiliensis TaxID=2162892 RepID=UPI00131F2040